LKIRFQADADLHVPIVKGLKRRGLPLTSPPQKKLV